MTDTVMTNKQTKKSFKAGDLIYFVTDTFEWVAKVDESDDDFQALIIADAIVRRRQKDYSEKDFADSPDDDNAENDIEDDDKDDIDLSDLDDDDDDEIVPMWVKYIDTIKHGELTVNRANQILRIPYSIVVSYADIDQFNVYMDLIQNWNSLFIENYRNRLREQTPTNDLP